MMDALGLAETTPGPLILVTQFVGMVAGQAEGGWVLAITAGVLTLWVTFVPCFIWIFAGAPLIDWLEGQARLQAALKGITAAVVGVIANLSVWFALHVFFSTLSELQFGPLRLLWPILGSINLIAFGLALLAGYAMLWRGWGMIPVMGLCAAISLLITGLG
jgi:chromate transporter